MLTLLFWILIFIVSLFFLIKASDYFITSSENIGVYLKFPPIVIGIIILSIGTSLPELISSIFAVLKSSSEIVIGTVIGSNIANLFLVLGILAVVSKNLFINKKFIQKDVPFFIATSLLLFLVVFNGFVSIFETLILLFIFVIYIIYTIKEIDLSQTIVEKKPLKKEVLKNIFIFVLSIVVIYFGAKYLIDATISLSEILNIGKEIIAISAIAFGTSLPELVVSIKAIGLKKHDLAIGNIIGSNIFNVLGIIGISSLFGTVMFNLDAFLFPLILMVMGTFLIYFIFLDRKVTKQEGFLLLALYVFFLFFVLGLI